MINQVLWPDVVDNVAVKTVIGDFRLMGHIPYVYTFPLLRTQQYIHTCIVY